MPCIVMDDHGISLISTPPVLKQIAESSTYTVPRRLSVFIFVLPVLSMFPFPSFLRFFLCLHAPTLCPFLPFFIPFSRVGAFSILTPFYSVFMHRRFFILTLFRPLQLCINCRSICFYAANTYTSTSAARNSRFATVNHNR